MKLRILVLVAALTTSTINPLAAADCEITCVDVYTQDGQLIFEARKGSGSKASVVVKPKTVAKPKARVAVKPKVVVSPKVIAKPKMAVAKKKTTPKKIAPAAATSLSDRISKSLPTAGISYQPNFQPLINVPVYFWSDVPTLFRSKVDLIGESIDVAMRPSFTWSFGDGSFTTTTDPGGPYPGGKITHIYSNPGTYPVILITTWGGSFSHNSIERAITGQIRKSTALSITVVAAPTRFMN
ncbi:MAG: PKD domain-containing protein [Candidatus Planktophila sp.]|nr:PKD domain-containing protein [Candidatus Planktophila sp.]